MEITDWEIVLKIQVISVVAINWHFNFFFKRAHDLSNQARLARIDIFTCRTIANLKNIIECIRWSTLKGIDPQIDMAPFHSNQTLNSIFCNKLNLSTINPPQIECKGLWKLLRLRIKTCMVLNLILITFTQGKCETVCLTPS